jgi:phosphatidate phosphatase APP1
VTHHKKHPIIWQLSILSIADNKSFVSGVILKSDPAIYHKNVGFIKSFINVATTYFIKPLANKTITIHANNQHFTTKTDQHGGFNTIINLKVEALVEITTPQTGPIPLKTIQNYPVRFLETQSAFDVISDIDDTIVSSHTANTFKRITTVSFVPPHKRKAIRFTQHFFRAIKNEGGKLYYVSKSESNLFGVLSYFIKYDSNFPQGILFLTPYINFFQLLFSKKPKDFKKDKIAFILQHSGSKKFILFGDDSQKDMEIYFDIANLFPKRILKIYIRQTKPTSKPKQTEMWKKLQTLKTPIAYFNDEMDIKKEINALKNM